MIKELKLFFVNYDFTQTYFDDKQKEFHQNCFDIVLRNWFANRIELSIPVDFGMLHLVECEDTETHKVLKYFFKAV